MKNVYNLQGQMIDVGAFENENEDWIHDGDGTSVAWVNDKWVYTPTGQIIGFIADQDEQADEAIKQGVRQIRTGRLTHGQTWDRYQIIITDPNPN